MTPFKRGYQAREQGLPPRGSGYPANTAMHRVWMTGWLVKNYEIKNEGESSDDKDV